MAEAAAAARKFLKNQASPVFQKLMRLAFKLVYMQLDIKEATTAFFSSLRKTGRTIQTDRQKNTKITFHEICIRKNNRPHPRA
jgi:hypothetical protein